MVDYICTNGHNMSVAGITVPNYQVVAKCSSTDELIEKIKELTSGEQRYADELGLFIISMNDELQGERVE